MIELDTRGLACPMPVIKLKKCLAENPEKGLKIRMQLSDKGGLKDIPAFCQQAGISLLETYDLSEDQFILIVFVIET